MVSYQILFRNVTIKDGEVYNERGEVLPRLFVSDADMIAQYKAFGAEIIEIPEGKVYGNTFFTPPGLGVCIDTSAITVAAAPQEQS